MKDDGVIGNSVLTAAVDAQVPKADFQNAVNLSWMFRHVRQANWNETPEHPIQLIVRSMFLSSSVSSDYSSRYGTKFTWTNLKPDLTKVWASVLAEDESFNKKRIARWVKTRRDNRGKKVSECPAVSFEVKCGDQRHKVWIGSDGRPYFQHKDLGAELLMTHMAYMLDVEKPNADKIRRKMVSEQSQEILSRIPATAGCVKTFMLYRLMGDDDAAQSAYYQNDGDGEFIYAPSLRNLNEAWKLRNQLALWRLINKESVLSEPPINLRLAQRIRTIYIEKVLQPLLEDKTSELRERIENASRRGTLIEVNVVPSFDFFGAANAESESVKKREKKGRGHNERALKSKTDAALTLFVPLRWYTTVYTKGLPSIVDGNFVLSVIRKMRKGMWLVRTSKTSDKFFRMRSALGTLQLENGNWKLTHVPNGYCGHKLFEECGS